MGVEGPASGVHVDVAAGQSAAQSVAGIVGEMKQILGRIQASSQDGGASWQGSAWKAFDATSTDWSATARKLEQALDEIEAKLTTGFKGYAEQDQAVAQQVTSAANSDLSI
ncbi:WXG100 family type VII secretion target [Gordonia sp. HNM0687]|uniref:ESAT-6-like protein n=1 Tax=Gordonia mangrovi TaxID=2665643 RepID=A0A6L7GKZ3_9ACTN|nr:WXG100 family type VII secretion target [Gordonia mangrovi]MXP20569.1 WXG100 family type VII secretion target [Gordonia mangrovi]UVF78841.1 WXG100 family type VII secretion target [Gordonia mangrovi]